MVAYRFDHANIEIIVSVEERLGIRGGLYLCTKESKELGTFFPECIKCLTENMTSDRMVKILEIVSNGFGHGSSVWFRDRDEQRNVIGLGGESVVLGDLRMSGERSEDLIGAECFEISGPIELEFLA